MHTNINLDGHTYLQICMCTHTYRHKHVKIVLHFIVATFIFHLLLALTTRVFNVLNLDVDLDADILKKFHFLSI